MKKITKLFLVILSAASLTLSSAMAGELTVTGGATATIVQASGGSDNTDKGYGISNELDFTANGELDNGFTWKWQTQLDDQDTGNDDTRLEVTTPFGTTAMYISEGDLSSKLTYGIGAMGTGSDYKNTFSTATGNLIWGKNIGSYNNVQYHTPAGLLPLDAQIKIGHAPNLSSTDGSSAKASGTVEDKAVSGNMQQIKVTATPVAGLSFAADFANYGDEAVLTNYSEESLGAALKYVTGPIAVGVGATFYQPTQKTSYASTTGTTNYESLMYGVQFAVNDALSVSVSEETFTKHVSSYQLDGTTAITAAADLEMEVIHLQAAYVVGGATLGIAVADTDNDDFTAGTSAKVTTFSVAMAF
jgi:hypothetical protein